MLAQNNVEYKYLMFKFDNRAYFMMGHLERIEYLYFV